jgi:PhoH-like ATPase
MAEENKKTKVTYIPDTNVALRSGDFMFNFANKEGNAVVILNVLLEEIDKKKSEKGDVGKNARQASTNIMKLCDRSTSKLTKGVKTREGGRVLLFSDYSFEYEKRLAKFHANIGTNDLRILAAVKAYKEKYPDENVKLVTMDKNLYIVAKENGIGVEYKRGEQIDPRTLYSGYRLIKNQELYDEIMLSTNGNYNNICFDLKDKKIPDLENLVTNEYVVFVDDELHEAIRISGKKPKRTRIFKYDFNGKALNPIEYNGQPILGYRPRNFEQMLAYDMLLDDDIKVKALVGEAGTGKTFIALLIALYKIKQLNRSLAGKDKESLPKILVTKRQVNVQNEEYGYIPGFLIEKILDNYLGFQQNYEKIAHGEASDLFDNQLWPKRLDEMLGRDPPIIKLLPLGIARGASLGPSDILIIEEAQNMESSAIRTLISRVGEGNGEVYLTGDITQTDNINTYEYDGLTHVVNAVQNTKDRRYTFILGALKLRHNERSDVSAWAARYL